VRVALLAAVALWGCSSAPVLEGPSPALLPPPPSKVASGSRPPPGKLYRDEVVHAVDAGFPRFLQKIEVEAKIDDGRFAGWIVRALYPREFWADVDLAPGDVVTSVNGLPIERETQAYDVFQSLKQAPRLVVSYTRKGEPRSLTFEIVQRPGPAANGTRTARN
jgi:S1-C subfamily serine protease